ncbi:MAG: protein-disulfide reductase DsbD [Pseudomonadota bacterium]
MKVSRRWVFILVGWLMVLIGIGGAQAAEFLPVDQVFKLTASTTAQGQVALDFSIAPKTHLYRDRFSVQAQPASVTLGAPSLPTGVRKFDEGFGKEVEVYYGQLLATVGVDAATPAGTPLTLIVGYQGCADEGICYPPQTRRFTVTLAEGGKVVAVAPVLDEGVNAGVSAGVASRSTQAPAQPAAAQTAPAPGPTDRISKALASGSLPKIVGVFFIAGLLLAFTPCVLPMVPILSSIIVGEGEVGRWRGFTLALSYSQGMALVYTLLGVAAGLLGEGLAASLQNPWVLGAMGLLMVALALSMFGAYELQIPSFVQGHLTMHSGRLQGGSLLAVFFMGVLSALIVGPCVSGPLAGALVYISQTRDVVLGGVALYALACGMSMPLLLVGVSAGSLLPRAGLWMESVKTFFGLVLLGVAWWLVMPVMSPAVQVWSLGGLLALAAAFTGGFDHLGPQASLRHRAFKALGVVLALLAAAEIMGALAGAQSPWDPLRPWLPRAQAQALGEGVESTSGQQGLVFKRVSTVAELDAAVAAATQARQGVMLDFYADWCVACKELEHFTFSDARVQAQLHNTVLLQADVTANTAADKALLKRFTLFGPPGIVFFDAQGQEVTGARVMGYQPAEAFLQSLKVAGI